MGARGKLGNPGILSGRVYAGELPNGIGKGLTSAGFHV
jgi:hypothetical protein